MEAQLNPHFLYNTLQAIATEALLADCQEIYDMILWWMDKGVGGFRLDVIDQIAKEPDRGITAKWPEASQMDSGIKPRDIPKSGLDYSGGNLGCYSGDCKALQ